MVAKGTKIVFELNATLSKCYQFFFFFLCFGIKKKNLIKCYLDNFIIINRHENTITKNEEENLEM